jgi:hypothetical protein
MNTRALIKIRFAAGIACAALSIGHAQSAGLRHGAHIVPAATAQADGLVGMPPLSPLPKEVCSPNLWMYYLPGNPQLSSRQAPPQTETLFDR